MFAQSRFKWGSAPNPVFGGNLLILGGRGSRGRKRFENPFDFGAAHARVRPWVKNPLVGWACSFLLDPMRILHHALSRFDMRR